MGIELLTVKNDKKNRFDDIYTMLEILDKNQAVCHQLILKSSLTLMLYNAIEGTISNLLVELFDTIVRKKVSIEMLPQKFQSLIYTYHLKEIGRDIRKLREFNNCDGTKLCNITYLEINKYLKLYSGNLDSKKIREVSEKLGIDLPKAIDEPCILQVKSIRNKLAHGETKFTKACQDITKDEMKKMSEKVGLYLDKIIVEYEKFFDAF